MDEESKLAIMRQLPSGLSFSVLGKKKLIVTMATCELPGHIIQCNLPQKFKIS